MALEDSDVWMRKTDSGKAVKVTVKGETYILALSQLKRLLSDEIEGACFSVVVPDEEGEG